MAYFAEALPSLRNLKKKYSGQGGSDIVAMIYR